MSKRWRKILVLSLGALAIVGVGAIVAMNAAVNLLLDQVAAVETELEANSTVDMTEPAKDSGGGSSAVDESLSGADDDAAGSSNIPGTAKGGEAESEGLAAPNDVQTGTAASDEGKGGVDETKLDGYVPPELAEAAKESVSTKDKLAVASVLLDHFSTGELQQFAGMAKDGISVAEKAEAKKIFLDRLSEEEYNRLIAIAAKHGLSKGRTYDEVKQELEHQQ